MSDSLSDNFPLPDTPPAATVLKDTPCRSCGYNLRTQPRDGVCPECATPVADSMGTHLLRDADPQFLLRLNAGLRISQWTLAGFVLATLFTMRGVPIVWRVATVGCSGGLMLGTWLLTTTDPSGLFESLYGRSRTIARWLGVMQFASVFLLGASLTAPTWIYMPAQYAAFAVGFMWALFLLLYLRKLSVRTAPVGLPSAPAFTMDGNVLAYIFLFLLMTVFYAFIAGGWNIHLMLARGRLSMFVLLSGLISFARALKAELAASKSPTLARSAGKFLGSMRGIFERGNGAE
jgi:hypothetical protein